MKSSRLFAFALLLPWLLTQCKSVQFYSQAIAGHWQIMQKAKPVNDVMVAPETQPALRSQLALSQRMLDYAAATLALPAQQQYRRYADLGRSEVSWIVCAAPEFSVKPKAWWYPLVGNLTYRGYFSKKAALAEAEKLRNNGFDILVSEVNAYSTLGYFHDPLLNTFIMDAEPMLAELLFHELTHQRLYIAGQTDFNEALATAVGQQGSRAWLRREGKATMLAEYEQGLHALAELQDLLGKTEAALAALYARAEREAWPPQAIRAEKARQFAMLKAACARHPQLRGRKGIQNWLSQPLSNAHLALHQTYYALVPTLERELAAAGSYEAFFQKMERQYR